MCTPARRVGEDRKSLTFALRFSAPADRTLTEDEASGAAPGRGVCAVRPEAGLVAGYCAAENLSSRMNLH